MQSNSVQTVQELCEAFRQRDIQKVFRLLSPDVEIMQSEEYNVPIVHVWKTRDGMVVQARFFIDHPTMPEALSLAAAR